MRTLLSYLLLLVLKLFGAERLDRHDALPLGSSLSDAIALYGDPFEVCKSDSLPESTEYTFDVSPFHGCVAWEWRGQIHCIVYFPEKSFPAPDLKFMCDNYGDGKNWTVATEGYLYFREDKLVRLWCSAMPPIGVATMEYWSAKEAYSSSIANGESAG
ncbi:hypothetical protein MFFC18_18220 [Mariniblastus fucicola]|uniref:Uncharacterized protein n=1 Tax=Mariniblastus fucicola TaxID=980251 RepID=A0A5B9PGE6_9BACT|nr:hypothetical protein MFFC18_18220 [Mariniblastus fucicola]